MRRRCHDSHQAHAQPCSTKPKIPKSYNHRPTTNTNDVRTKNCSSTDKIWTTYKYQNLIHTRCQGYRPRHVKNNWETTGKNALRYISILFWRKIMNDGASGRMLGHNVHALIACSTCGIYWLKRLKYCFKIDGEVSIFHIFSLQMPSLVICLLMSPPYWKDWNVCFMWWMILRSKSVNCKNAKTILIME